MATNHSKTESLLILPQLRGDGMSAVPAIIAVEEALRHFFGGFTMHIGIGAYVTDLRDDVERVRVYTVASDWSQENSWRLMRIARRFAKDAMQKFVYVRVEGEVYFVEPF